MKKKFSLITASSLIGLMMFIMLSAPDVAIEGATKGLLLWFEKLLPSLLPFIILMNMLCALGIFFQLSDKLSFITNKCFGVSGTSFMLFLLGLAGGYPMGAKLTKQLLDTHQITYEEAQKSLCFSTNCGPIFIIGTVGTILLGNARLGYLLLAIHLCSALAMLLLARFYKPQVHSRIMKPATQSAPPSLAAAFTQSVQNAMDTIVYVGGYIIFFSVIIELLKHADSFSAFTTLTANLLGLSADVVQAALLGSLEFSNGSALVAQTLSPTLTNLALLSALIAFGGICVFFQCAYVLQGSGLKLHIYLIAKCIQAIIAYILTLLILPLTATSFIATTSFIQPIILLLATCLLCILIFNNLKHKIHH